MKRGCQKPLRNIIRKRLPAELTALFALILCLCVSGNAGDAAAQTAKAQTTAKTGTAKTGTTKTSGTKAKEKTVTGAVLNVSKIPAAAAGKFKKVGQKYRFIYKDGTKAVGWKKIRGKIYYFSDKGYRYTGMKKIGKYYYYFSGKGVRKLGWIKKGGKKYYFRKDKNGIRVKGRIKIGKSWYYFKSNGSMAAGWVKRSGKFYYFKDSGKQAFGWCDVDGGRYYLDPEADGAMVTGRMVIEGRVYYFSQEGSLSSIDRPDFKQIDTTPYEDSYYVDSSGNRLKRSTIKKLLQTAMKPVGSTMYVWGGGWTVAGNADIVARTIGVSSRWKEYFDQQTAAYDYTKTRWQTKDGLDCSGFVGWVIYNTFNNTSGNAGYVMGAEIQARTFADYGWGSYTPNYNVTDFRAGDIMSLSSGHVYIVVGQCSDGSVVLIHSSPNGVMISGTTTRSGNRNSEAIMLSDRYMKYYYPEAYAKFNVSEERHIWRDEEYLTQYSRMRWYLGGYQTMMSDPDGYTGMSAAQVLRDLFEEG